MDANVKRFVNISIWLTAILTLVRYLISWSDVKNMWEAGHVLNLSYSSFGFIGEAIGIAAILMAIFNKWAWKWKWLCWMNDVPVLAKNYCGTFISDYDSTKRFGEIVIDQTFLNVAILLKTEESTSRSLTASFGKVQSVQYLIYTYQNDPRAEIQDRSPMHYGTAMLNISNPMVLEGNYFTGRKSRGSMKFEAVKSRVKK
jgi:hypothetical protein